MIAILEELQNFSKLGETLALIAALVWAVGIILFRISGRVVHPLGLNLFKNVFTLPFIVALSLLLGESLLPNLGTKSYLMMFLSGAIGIGVSDTLLFASLNRLGAGLSAIVNCTYSPFIIAFSWIILGERMLLIQLAGTALIISAVLTVSQKKMNASIPRRNLIQGILLGIAAMGLNGIAVVMMKSILDESPLLWTVIVRLLGGILILWGFIHFHPRRRGIWKETLNAANWHVMIPASFFGSILGFILWTGGMKYIQASEASALNQMHTIFIFFLGIIFLKEKASTLRLAALFLAVIGAVLVTLP